MKIPVVHADGACVVVLKPPGLLAVPGRGDDKQDCLWRRVQADWPDALVVHRLDQATSGLMLLARGLPAQRALSAQFEARTVVKRYVAVVAGALDGTDWQRIDLPIAADWPNRPRRVVHPDGQPSQTRWRTAPAQTPPWPGATRLELEPLTGRTHQLRVHLQALGHPILGDALYGDAATAPRLLLHAAHLGFRHPADGRAMAFDAPPGF